MCSGATAEGPGSGKLLDEVPFELRWECVSSLGNVIVHSVTKAISELFFCMASATWLVIQGVSCE